jgi:hypothetical protein
MSQENVDIVRPAIRASTPQSSDIETVNAFIWGRGMVRVGARRRQWARAAAAVTGRRISGADTRPKWPAKLADLASSC